MPHYPRIQAFRPFQISIGAQPGCPKPRTRRTHCQRSSILRRKSHRRETGGETSHLGKKLCTVSAIFKYNPRSTLAAYVHRRGTAMNTQSSSSPPCPPHALGPNAPAHAAGRVLANAIPFSKSWLTRDSAETQVRTKHMRLPKKRKRLNSSQTTSLRLQ